MRTTNMAIRHAALKRVSVMLNRQYLKARRSVDPSSDWDQIEVDIRNEVAEILLSLDTDISTHMAQAVDTYKQRS